ncbi:hypothetical protein D3C86_1657180 [compost metagenome]
MWYYIWLALHQRHSWPSLAGWPAVALPTPKALRLKTGAGVVSDTDHSEIDIPKREEAKGHSRDEGRARFIILLTTVSFPAAEINES